MKKPFPPSVLTDEEVFEKHRQAWDDFHDAQVRIEMYREYIMKDQGTYHKFKEWQYARNKR
jgi:hypothetical protein